MKIFKYVYIIYGCISISNKRTSMSTKKNSTINLNIVVSINSIIHNNMTADWNHKTKPSNLLFHLTKLFSTDEVKFNNTVREIATNHTPSRKKYIENIVEYLHKWGKTFKNPNRICATRIFLTRLQEEAHHNTTPHDFTIGSINKPMPRVTRTSYKRNNNFESFDWNSSIHS